MTTTANPSPTSLDPATRDLRLARVRSHVAAENAHDTAALTDGFFAEPLHTLNGASVLGADAFTERHTTVWEGFGDLAIEEVASYTAGRTVVQESIQRATHTGAFNGIPPTGKSIVLPVCTIFVFDEYDEIVEERVYLDVATVLGQLGLLG